jgi:hypothetical protein
MPDLILTDEQRKIVSLDVPKGQVLKISAFAGTAKTTTLREFTKAHLNKTFLYLAYNKSVGEEAKATFPSNVECRTTHSLAFQFTGKPYGEQIRMGNLKPFMLTDHLYVKKYGLAKYIIDVVIKFLASADSKINESHLVINPDADEEQYLLQKDPDTIKYLITKANRLWERMQEIDFQKIPMTHDGYLKLFQLSKPQLDYDYILLDEAHDTNPVVLDIFLNQNAAKIIVGDSHQCQPKGTKVKLEGGIEKDISEIKIGDRVITYRPRQSYFIGTRNQGKKVTQINSRFFNGKLYEIQTKTGTTLCTNNHKWLVKFSNCENCYIVYLMQKGTRFRTGLCKAFYKGGSGIGVRCRHERADKGWILSIHDNFEEALLQEKFVSYQFGISQHIFQERSSKLGFTVTKSFIDSLYNQLKNMEERAIDCLLYFHRNIEYPIYTKKNGLQRGGRRPFVVEACNLISEKMQIPTFHNNKNPVWQDITVKRKPFKGIVYSLDVEKDHNYIANNMLTHNSCYGFRWAYNALDQVQGDIHKYLSNSFRFNHEIAAVANLILNKIKKEPKKLIGVGKAGMVGKINKNDSYAIVARTNAALFDYAAALLQEGKSYGFIGTNERDNFDPYRHYYFDRIEDVFRLYSGEKKRIKDKYIKRFSDFNSFLAVIKDKDAPDIELQSRANVVLKHKTNIPLLINSIRYNSIDPKKAHILFTTAHRAKGMEWPQVMLTNDYADLVIEGKNQEKRLATLHDVDEQEVNLEYIACTRAKKILQINESILKLIEYEKVIRL